MTVEFSTAIIGLEIAFLAIAILLEHRSIRRFDRRMEEDHHAMMASLRGLR